MEVLYWKYVKEQFEIFQKLWRCKINERWLFGVKQDLWFIEEDCLEEFFEDFGVVDDFLEFEEYVEEFVGVMFEEVVDFDVEVMLEFLRYEELVWRNVEFFIVIFQKFIQEIELS